MVRYPPSTRGDVAAPGGGPASGVPLIVTAELPGEVLAFAQQLRRQHYPPELNRVPAHVTLFHALPPASEAEVQDLLKNCAAESAPPPARMTGVMPFAKGTALRISSAQLLALREQLAERLHGLLSAQDRGVPKLHITVQNKVSSREARVLQMELESRLEPQEFVFPGLALHAWRGGPWEQLKRWSFRG